MKYCAKKKKKIMSILWTGFYTVMNLKYYIIYNIISS